MGERALERARDIDGRVQQGKAGSLAGVVMATKDILAMKDQPLTCGSHILNNYKSPFDATLIERLEAEDAIIIGKTNMDEFAMGSSTENSHFGAVKNPLDTSRVPGGSSGGSAVAVAADMALAAIGTDTGGSIRQPAAFCGVVGLKPTYGRVSRYGLVAYASSFDQAGPITRTVEDAALVLETIAGVDPHDSTSAPIDVPRFSSEVNQDVQGLRIGLPKEYFAEGLAPDMRSSLKQAIELLDRAGAKIMEVSLPHTEYAIATYYVLVTAEASSNLARYDGARYGFRSENPASLDEMYIQSRTQGFGEEVKRRIMLGTYVLSAGYYDAYYRKAQKVRTLIRRDFDEVFKTCDCLLTPTAPTTAFKLGDKLDNPLTMYLADIYTVSVNLAGLPAISVPCGKDSSGLPVGLQLIGKPFDESMVIRIGDFVEKQIADQQNAPA